MLSLWKLRVGVEAYYLAQVASGLDDYYTGSGEATGEWVGSAAGGLGLTGEVTGEDLGAVLAGLVPGTGLTPNGTVLRSHPRRVPGFDLTFSVPKSVSVVYALGDVRLQGAVLAAAELAVRDTLGWLEREACWVRRGSNNRSSRLPSGEAWGTRPMAARGFVAAMFRHRTSRAGDPQLHWHVLVANLSQGVDGRWSALDGTALYRTKRAAGAVFQARLRDELTQRLGMEWGPSRQDVAEIAGVPRRVVRVFSKRREQIEEWLDVHGRQGPIAAQEATLATRTAKTAVDMVGLDAAWKQEATALGWGPDELEALAAAWVPAGGTVAVDGERWLVRSGGPDGEGDGVRVVGFDEWVRVLLTSRLTAHDATFTRTEVTAAVAGAVGSGASVGVIERLTDRVLAHAEVVPVVSGTAISPVTMIGGPVPDANGARYTARDLLEAESRFLSLVTAGRKVRMVPVDAGVLASVLASRPSLGDDQTTALTTLTSSGRGVDVLVGRAGTGKTFLLGAVRDCFERSGHQVFGLAPSARAARELEEGAGIVSVTIARHLHTRLPDRVLRAGDVLVVDEAAMAATRDLTRVLDQAAGVGAKVILVGDHCQLPEVGPGGGYRAALDVADGGVCELTVNRRQIEPWEHDALDHLRHGEVPTAWAMYRAHDRVVLADTAAGLEDRVISDWSAHRAGGVDVLLLAGTRAQAERLNRLARRRLLDAGQLDDGNALVGERRFAVGDRVVLLRNSDRLRTVDGAATRVDNGTIATVTGTDLGAGSLVVAVNGSGRSVVVDRDYLAGGWVDHGYALTIHKAQGVTCDVVLAVGPAGMFREAGYTAMSRARHRAVLYATVEQADRLAEPGHSTGIPLPDEQPRAAEDVMLERLGRRHAKTFVTTDDPDALAVAELARRPLDELGLQLVYARRVEAGAPVPDPTRRERAFARAVHTRERLTVGGRARALDRDNLGTVLAIDDSTGTASVEFVSEQGDVAVRLLDWDQLIPVDHPDRTDVSAAAAATLAARPAAVVEARDEWAGYLHALGIEPGDRVRLHRAIGQRELLLGRSLHATSPAWLTTWLGDRPADQIGANVWDETVTALAAFRDRHHVPHDTAGLGPRPTDGGTDVWDPTMLEVLDTVAWLHHRQPTWPEASRTARPLAALLARQIELQAVMATAPDHDHHLVRTLVEGGASAGDLHGQLAAASGTRRGWILEHWPDVVELEQVTRLLAHHDPLAGWPTATSPRVAATLADLHATVGTAPVREERTLAQLASLVERADPEHQLRAHLAALHRQVADADPAGDVARLLPVAIERTEAALRQARHDRTISDILARYTPPASMGDDLHTAWANRTATILADTVAVPSRWLYELLDVWDHDGTLDQLDSAEITQRVRGIVCYRDRWAIDSDDPVGDAPTDPVQRLEWSATGDLMIGLPVATVAVVE